MFIRRLMRDVGLVFVLAPSIALAQSAAPATPIQPVAPPAVSGSPAAAVPSSATTAPSSATQTAVDQRIRALQSQLGITDAQIPLWSAFAQAMRDNAAATDALFTQRAAAVAAMNAPDNMRSYAQIARAYAENTERLATAFDSLYASLSDTQKQAADKLFRQQATAATQPRARR